jgi:hypothetical protein
MSNIQYLLIMFINLPTLAPMALHRAIYWIQYRAYLTEIQPGRNILISVYPSYTLGPLLNMCADSDFNLIGCPDCISVNLCYKNYYLYFWEFC